MNEDGKVAIKCELDVLFEDGELAFGVLIQADLTDAEDVWFIEELWDDCHYFACESGVFRFLGVDAEPAEVRDAIFGGALRFVIGELAVVVVKSCR